MKLCNIKKSLKAFALSVILAGALVIMEYACLLEDNEQFSCGVAILFMLQWLIILPIALTLPASLRYAASWKADSASISPLEKGGLVLQLLSVLICALALLGLPYQLIAIREYAIYLCAGLLLIIGAALLFKRKFHSGSMFLLWSLAMLLLSLFVTGAIGIIDLNS